jgi:hypothetical protein
MWKKIWPWVLLLWTPIDRVLSKLEHAEFVTQHLPWMTRAMEWTRQMFEAPNWVVLFAIPGMGFAFLLWVYAPDLKKRFNREPKPEAEILTEPQRQVISYDSDKPRLLYPKWMYRANPDTGQYQCTLVGNAEAEAEIGPTWTDDPHGHGIAVVPLPAELRSDGTLMHLRTRADANGNFAYGPAPTVPGVCEGSIRIPAIPETVRQIPEATAAVLPEHQLRKYYSIAEAATIVNISEETIYQLAIAGDIRLSIVEHRPSNYEMPIEEIVDGKTVKATRQTVTAFSVGDDSASLDLWYISPRDAKNVIRNPPEAVTLISVIFRDRECVPKRAKGFLNSYLRIARSDLLVSSEELKRFLAARSV